MSLSDMQRSIVDAMLKKPDEAWDVDKIAKAAYTDRPRPKTYRVSIMQIMRGLIAKTSSTAYNYRVVRTSAVGRSARAQYKLIRSAPRRKADRVVSVR